MPPELLIWLKNASKELDSDITAVMAYLKNTKRKLFRDRCGKDAKSCTSTCGLVDSNELLLPQVQYL